VHGIGGGEAKRAEGNRDAEIELEYDGPWNLDEGSVGVRPYHLLEGLDLC
jgi:hypothetical protein